MRPFLVAAIACNVLLILPSPTRAAELKKPAVPGVDRAVARAQQFLIGAYEGQGKFGGSQNQHMGNTALCVYALVKSKAALDQPAITESIKKMLDYANAAPGTEDKGTYNSGLVMLALDALRDAGVGRNGPISPGDQEPGAKGKGRGPFDTEMRKLASALLKAQHNGTTFRYGVKRLGGFDRSVDQYAMLGMWAARRSGLPIKKTFWTKMAAFFIKRQDPDGGWAYKTGGSSTHAMTAATIGSLAICHLNVAGKRMMRQEVISSPGDETGDKPEVVERKDNSPVAKAIGKGFAWLATNGLDNTKGFNPYYIYALERACALTKTQRIGDRDWYTVKAKDLMAKQKGNGSWDGGHGDRCCTAWNLLFLTRATEDNFKPKKPRYTSPGESS
ncbi:MAG: hypothetical protein OER86_07605 [Phycisphaerae bacterium]|nr:hypothetical protein [Phycisphaerae bacterium]